MRTAIFILVSIVALPTRADLSDFDPEELCGLLNDFGIETTPFEVASGPRRLCYTVQQPGSLAEQYEFSYRVLDSAQGSRASLFIHATGRGDNFFAREPQWLYEDMVERLLTHFYGPSVVADVMAALRDLGPNERGRGTGNGLTLYFYRIHRLFPGFPEGVELRFTVSNACAVSMEESSRQQCLNAASTFAWQYRREEFE